MVARAPCSNAACCSGSPGKTGATFAADDAHPNVTAAEDTLQRALGTRVRIVQGRRGSGRLELHFFGEQELDRLYGLVLGAARGAAKPNRP